MANNVDVSVLLKLNDEVSVGLSKLSGNLSKTGAKFANLGSQMLKMGAVAGTVAAGAAVAFVKMGAEVAGNLESAEQGFKALLGSAEKASDVMKRIKKEASATPFEIEGLVRGTQALTAITKDGDKAIDILLDVGKAVAVSGKSSAEMERVILNLQQISATGKVTAMDIRQFQGAIPIFNDIITAAGLTVDQLQEADNAAELLFGAFKKAGAEGGIAAEGFTAQAGTFNQLMSNLRDSINIASADIVKQTGLFNLLKDVIGQVSKSINENKDTVVNAIISLQGTFVSVVEWVNKFLDSVKQLWSFISPVVIPMLDLLNKNFQELLKSLNLNEDSVAILKDIAKGLAIVLGAVLAVALGVVWVAINALILIIRNVVNTIKFWLEQISKAAEAFQNLKTRILEMVDAIKRIPSKVTTTIEQITKKISGKATGGLVSGSTPYMVGERGPELFVPQSSGRIVPNDQLQSRSSNALTLNVNVGVYAGSEIEKRNLATDLYRALVSVAQTKNMTVAELLGA